MFSNIGRTLLLLRELRGMSQSAVARKAGIGKSQLSKYETGKELPKLDSLEKIIVALGVGYFEFFYTLQIVDRRADTLGRDPTTARIAAPRGSALLSEKTEAAFDLVFALLARLQRQVWGDALALATGRAELADQLECGGPDSSVS